MFPTKPNLNQPAQPQRQAKVMNFGSRTIKAEKNTPCSDSMNVLAELHHCVYEVSYAYVDIICIKHVST